MLAAGLAVLFGLPAYGETYLIINSTIFAAFAILALSLALIWGYAGILCFGQAAFFGLGGYTYAVAAINMGDTTVPALLAVLVPASFAALLGYFMFWGRISDVYLGVITLTVSLIFFRFINQTAGEQWNIGDAPLGGFNGIPATPILNWPARPGDQLAPEDIFSLAVGLLLIVYFSCKALLATSFGRVIVAIRENETRAELLGYDARVYKLAIFVIGGAHGRPRRPAVRQLGVRQPDHVQPAGQRPDHHLGDHRRARHPDRAGHRLHPDAVPDQLSRHAEPAQGLRWVDPNLVLGVLLVIFVLAGAQGPDGAGDRRLARAEGPGRAARRRPRRQPSERASD